MFGYILVANHFLNSTEWLKNIQINFQTNEILIKDFVMQPKMFFNILLLVCLE